MVAILLPSSIDFAVAYAAASRLGAVATGINTRLGRTEITAILDRCRPAVLFHDGGHDADPVPVGRAPSRASVMARRELRDLASRGRGARGRRRRRAPEDPACIVWTSGTTGTPKGAWFDHRALRASAEMSGILSAPFDVRSMPVPFAHAGYMNKVWDQLAWVVTCVLAPGAWTAEAMLAMMVREHVTAGQGVPTQWTKLLELPRGSRRRPVVAAARVDRLGAGVARARRGDAHAARVPDRGALRVHRVVDDDGHGARRSARGVVAHRRSTARRRRAGARRRRPAWRSRRARSGSFACARAVRWAATGRSRRAPRRRCRPTGGSSPATSDGSAPTATSCCAVAAPRCTSAVATTCIRSRSSTRCRSTPASTGSRCSGAPAPTIGEIGVAFVVPVDPRRRRRRATTLRAWCLDRLADYKAPDEVDRRRRASAHRDAQGRQGRSSRTRYLGGSCGSAGDDEGVDGDHAGALGAVEGGPSAG